MNLDEFKHLSREGIWDNNVVFSQMLALCPLLAVTSTASNGLGMGLASTFVMVVSSTIVSSVRKVITPEVRIPVFVLLIAATVTVVDMTLNAYMHDLHKVLGLFIPLIVTNCAILGRVEAFAYKQHLLPSAIDGFMMGLGFTLVLVVLGGVREILGSGALFANADLLLGESFAFLEITLLENYRGYLLMLLPAGGFITMGFILAGKRLLDKQFAKRAQLKAASDRDEDLAEPQTA